VVVFGGTIMICFNGILLDCNQTFRLSFVVNFKTYLNLLMPNVNYSGRTAPLTSKVAFYTGCPRRNVLDFGRVFLC